MLVVCSTPFRATFVVVPKTSETLLTETTAFGCRLIHGGGVKMNRLPELEN